MESVRTTQQNACRSNRESLTSPGNARSFMRGFIWVLPCLLLAFDNTWAQASRSVADELPIELQAMRARQEALEAENKQLRTQLDAIEARLAPNAPTVTETMAASLAADAVQPKQPVKFTPGGGGFALNDGPYSLTFY